MSGTPYRDVIALFGDAPDSQLDTSFAAECKVFQPKSDDEAIEFLRDLRDKIVHAGAGSDFVMQTLNTLLAPHPETPEAREQRHARLKSKWT